MIVQPGIAVKMVTVLPLNLERLSVFDEQCKIAIYCAEAYIRIYTADVHIYFLSCGM